MLGRRIGRGGLLRTAARTAVIAGTATAVSGGIQDRRAARSQQAADAEAYELQQQQSQVDATGNDLMTQLQSLATLHSQGVLSDAEFTAAKAKLLA